MVPGNRAVVVRQRKPTAAATTGADTLELTTLRCSQYNTKAGRADSINDQVPVLNQAQMTDLALAIEKASDELVTLAQTVDKGKPKRDRLTKAIARASDMAAKAESKEAKAVVAAPPPAANKKITANLKNLKRDLGKLEQRMFELQTQKHELEARLSTQTPPLSPQEIGELGLKLQTINDTLADCEDQWLLLSEQIEAES